MKISIIIPAFNSADTIEKSVLSIVNQPAEHLQIIIVDDHSGDDTFDICGDLKSKYPCIELYRNEGRGVSDARNTGLKYADGDIIGFCDADDCFEDNAFRVVSEAFGDDPRLDLLCCGIDVKNPDGELLQEKRAECKYISAEQMLERVLLDSRILGSVCNKFYKKEIIADARFESALSYCEDTAFNAEVLLGNKDARCLVKDICVYDYVSNPKSATHGGAAHFNEDGVLKYNKSMYHIRRMAVTGAQRRYVDRAIFVLSTAELCYTKPEKEQKALLRAEIRRCFLPYLMSFYKFEPVRNIKIMIKGFAFMLYGGSDRLLDLLTRIRDPQRDNGRQ